MTFREYVLSYEVGGKIAADLYDYYDRFIKTLDKRFESYSYYSSNLVLCFFKDHNDINPSMGSISDKRLKGVKVCHCFGCGRTADVVRIHQILCHQYQGRELSEKEACLEIASMFDIPVSDFEDIEEEDYEAKYTRNLKKIVDLSRRYTIRDFEEELYATRKAGVDLNRVNSSCVKMIATVKQLYD